jgi:RNA polymerase sigma-70 factor, ECF subfamily
MTPSSNENEAFLVRQVLTGRKERFWELLQPHIAVLSHIVRGQIRNDSEAEDVVQDTLLKAYTRLGQFRFEASFRTWLIQIAINESRQWYRRGLRSRLPSFDQSPVAENQIVDDVPSPLDECERQEMIRSLHRALANLPEKYQSVIRLREFEYLSISETARSLHLSVSAVKSRHRRGRLLMTRFLVAGRVRFK